MTTKLDIFNNALDLVGQGTHIQTLTESSKEADICNRTFDLTVQRCLDKYNFSFARKDEVITSSNLQSSIVSLPWSYTYTLPSDVMRVLYLSTLDSDSEVERIRRDLTQFNFRVVNNTRYLVTNMEAPFVIHYQADVTDLSLFSVTFIEALEYMLAARIASSLIHGTSGITISQNLLQTGNMYLSTAASQDAQQGADSIRRKEVPALIQCRG